MRGLFTHRRLMRLTGFASTQVVVQAIGFAAGIVLVRHMEQAQYGYYTLAISMVGVGNVLMDLGLATAVLAIGGPSKGDWSRMGPLLMDALSLQRRLAILACVVLIPAFALMFEQQGLEPLRVGALSLVAIACVGLNARNQLALSFVRLQGDIVLQQRLEIGVNFGKLLLILMATLVYLNAVLALIVNLTAAAALFALLLRHLAKRIGFTGQAPRTHRGQLRSLVLLQAPNSIYYCISGQVSLWLVGWLGSADRVAEAGALGRLALLFVLIGAVVTALVQPHFARTTQRGELVAGFVAMNAFFALLTLLLATLAVLLPAPLLWILGPSYGALTEELVWMVVAASLAAWSGAAYAVSAARGWVVPTAFVISMGVTTIALCAYWIDMSTVRGSFMMNTATGAMATVLTVAFGAHKLSRMRPTQEPGAAQ